MKLRKPCEHDRYEEHVTQTWLYQFDRHDRVTCPGGEFLADDALMVNKLRAAILDIDAHATPLGSDEDGFVTTGYVVSVGAIHRALGLVRGAG